MEATVKYLGGKKHGQECRMNIRDLPERAEGGMYIYFGSHAVGACDPAGPYPKPRTASAVWVTDS